MIKQNILMPSNHNIATVSATVCKNYSVATGVNSMFLILFTLHVCEEHHFISNIPAGEGWKRKKPSKNCFLCSKIPGMDVKKKRTSFWCEDCRKVLCISPCFRIYHMEKDFKRCGPIYREMDDVLIAESVDDGNENDYKF